MNILEIMGDIPLNTSDKITFGQIDIINITFFKNRNLLNLDLNSNSPLIFENYSKIKKMLEKKLEVNVEIKIDTQSSRYDLNTISKYIDYITKSNKELFRLSFYSNKILSLLY